MKPSFPFEIESTVVGIPCVIGISHYISIPAWSGSAHTCPSSEDYYGYTEMEWEVLDRKGYKAEWLGKKLTDKDRDRIEVEIEEFFSDMDRDYW